MIIVLDHPLVSADITTLRDGNTLPEIFRAAVNRIGVHLAIECFKELDLDEFDVETPLETTTGYKITSNILIIPILRAGLALLDSFLNVYPKCKIGYIAMKRNEQTFKSQEYYYSIPEINAGTKVIILEVMLATGGSVTSALSNLQLERNASDITVVSLISAPEGIEKIRAEYPSVKIITAVMDRELNDRKYILPGLGDAGDRINGTE
jgi:uracil phosphoribosyltransferase